MQFGTCGRPEDSAWIKAAGADFLECLVQPVLRPLEAEWKPDVPRDQLALPLPAFNAIFPPQVRLTGPDVNMETIRQYSQRTMDRMKALGSTILVFGSGVARMVPEGWPRAKADDQIVEILKLMTPMARAAGIEIVLEPLNRGESNLLNTLPEGLEYMRRAPLPGLSMLVDFFHFGLDGEPIDDIDLVRGVLKHVHIGEPAGRVPPMPGLTDWKPYFRKLKKIGYDDRIAIEVKWTDMKAELKPSLDYLRREWAAA